MTSVFVSCPSCLAQWETMEMFLDDSEVRFSGIQANHNFPKKLCHFHFTHSRNKCGERLAIRIEKFNALLEKPPPEKSMAGDPDCDGKCLDLNNFLECDKPCRNAPYRNLARRLIGLQTSLP